MMRKLYQDMVLKQQQITKLTMVTSRSRFKGLSRQEKRRRGDGLSVATGFESPARCTKARGVSHVLLDPTQCQRVK
jgi:hypothetical protein